MGGDRRTPPRADGGSGYGQSDKLAYTVEEAGRAIGLSRSTVFDMIRLGQLQAKKVRGRTVITRPELLRVIDAAPAARLSRASPPSSP